MKIIKGNLFGRENTKVYEGRPGSVIEVLNASVKRFGDKEAIVTEKDAITYKELDLLSSNLAQNLVEDYKINKGDRIATLVGNSTNFSIILFACAKVGAIMVPLNTKLTEKELSFIIKDSKPAAIFLENKYTKKIHNVLRELRMTSNLFNLDEVPQFHDYSLLENNSNVLGEINEEDSLLLIYTSGTTGQPKGALISHINIIHSIISYKIRFETSSNHSTLIAVPMFHVTGLVGQLLHVFYVGGTVYSMYKYQNKAYIDTILKYKINFLFNVPTIFIMLSREEAFQKNSFDFVKKIAYGGSPIYKQTYELLRSVFPNADLHNAYGATETTSPATLMPVEYSEDKVVSVGLPVPVADIKIIDDDGKSCKPGEIGEIYIRGPMVIKEYWNNDDANLNNFTNGYWHSGDIGTQDHEGFIYVLDRKKDMINKGGEKIFSIEVEDVLKSHKEIVEAAVIGVPDEIYGEKVRAYIVSESLKEHQLSQVEEHCKKYLAKYKVPDEFKILESLPRNASGKILKMQLNKGRD